MQIQTVLLIVLVGAVAVLAKRGGSSEEDRNVVPLVVSSYPNVDPQPMYTISGPKGKGKRKPNRYPQGRPFQSQQQIGDPQMSSFYPQRPGMQQTSFGPQGGNRPFGQDPEFSFGNSQQNPSHRPFYAGRPNQSFGNGRPSQYPGQGRPNQFPGQDQSFGNGRPSQYPGQGRPNQFPGQGLNQSFGSGRPNQFPGQGRPGSSQWPAGAQFPGNAQVSGNGQYPGFPGNSQLSANAQYPGNSFSTNSEIPNNGQPSFNAQFPGSNFPMTS